MINKKKVKELSNLLKEYAIKMKLLGFNGNSNIMMRKGSLFTLPFKGYFISFDGFQLTFYFNDSIIKNNIINSKNEFEVSLVYNRDMIAYLPYAIYTNNSCDIFIQCLKVSKLKDLVFLNIYFYKLDNELSIQDSGVYSYSKSFSSLCSFSDIVASIESKSLVSFCDMLKFDTIQLKEVYKIF